MAFQVSTCKSVPEDPKMAVKIPFSGKISANGGNGASGGGGGGGGMIAIKYKDAYLGGQITCYGGAGAEDGAAGTVYFVDNDSGETKVSISFGGVSVVVFVVVVVVEQMCTRLKQNCTSCPMAFTGVGGQQWNEDISNHCPQCQSRYLSA